MSVTVRFPSQYEWMNFGWLRCLFLRHAPVSLLTCPSLAGRGSPSCTQRRSRGDRSLESPPSISPRWRGSASLVTVVKTEGAI